ncbi:uncharacterized protein LOC108156664 isoform X2 [Drosophila miranda]|uniref:uncharacterized protein LOC108156664 isoform X2 n=1 Tax=Drosophila miranda TaxID=7229 RepID=UPI0007E7E502|nr:uncharacterized protein LOC108156664 isoform X2 [Drosophila miranda]
MDNSGYNRYELLSTYDEDVATAISIKMNVGLSNKKQIKKTVLNKPEKENKPMTGKHNNLGKTEKIVKRVVGNVTKKENKGLSDAKNIVHIRSNENNRFGGVDFGNDIPQRQFKDRDNRGQQRFGNGEKYGKREFDRQSGSGKTEN